MKKLITYLTTTKDNPEDLIFTASSLVNQTSMDFQWLVYDGSVRDEDKIKKIFNDTSKIIPNTKYIHRLDSSWVDAFNNAITNVDTDYLLLLNCGDGLAGKDVNERINIELGPCPNLLIMKSVYVDENGKPAIHENSDVVTLLETLDKGEEPYFKYMTSQQSIVYKKHFLMNLKFDGSYFVAADHKQFVSSVRNEENLRCSNIVSSYYFAGGSSWRHGYICVLDWWRINITENINQKISKNLHFIYIKMCLDSLAKCVEKQSRDRVINSRLWAVITNYERNNQFFCEADDVYLEWIANGSDKWSCYLLLHRIDIMLRLLESKKYINTEKLTPILRKISATCPADTKHYSLYHIFSLIVVANILVSQDFGSDLYESIYILDILNIASRFKIKINTECFDYYSGLYDLFEKSGMPDFEKLKEICFSEGNFDKK